ncbi:MAG: hypothetical protein J3R72DRAFT_449463 [Linnemannia gamsii]|nr:MAG: hypothetical protein J3R72DRAFT_449463 [Linnemannia gamsii]
MMKLVAFLLLAVGGHATCGVVNGVYQIKNPFMSTCISGSLSPGLPVMANPCAGPSSVWLVSALGQDCQIMIGKGLCLTAPGIVGQSPVVSACNPSDPRQSWNTKEGTIFRASNNGAFVLTHQGQGKPIVVNNINSKNPFQQWSFVKSGSV